MDDTYERWRAEMLTQHADEGTWKSLGNWLCATKGNSTYSQVVFHLCRENQYKGSNCEDLERCSGCNTPTPEGIRMIALMQEL